MRGVTQLQKEGNRAKPTSRIATETPVRVFSSRARDNVIGRDGRNSSIGCRSRACPSAGTRREGRSESAYGGRSRSDSLGGRTVRGNAGVRTWFASRGAANGASTARSTRQQ